MSILTLQANAIETCGEATRKNNVNERTKKQTMWKYDRETKHKVRALQNNVVKQHCESIAKEFKRKCRRDEGSEGRIMRWEELNERNN